MVRDTATTSSSDAGYLNKKVVHDGLMDGKELHDTNFESTESLLRPRNGSIELATLGQHYDANGETIALEAPLIEDDPTLNPWTFRMFFLGMFLYTRIPQNVLTRI